MHDILDRPIWHAMTGPQARFTLGSGDVLRFQPAFAPFADMASLSGDNLAALAQLMPEQAVAVMFTTVPVVPPAGLEIVTATQLSQMVAIDPVAAGDEIEMVTLGSSDVPAMLELVALTQPGPFAARTIELGRYLGIWENGRLVAMTGERLHPPGYTEVSAVCTHPEFRGRGYAKALVSRVARGIAARGETPFLHVLPHNEAAIATYAALGFAERRLIELTVLRKPQAD